MTSVQSALFRRTSVESYEAQGEISHVEIDELILSAIQAPSAFNLQHWRFIAITDAALRSELKTATLVPNQRRVVEASACILILGDLGAHRQLPVILEDAVTAGSLRRTTADEWLATSNTIYATEQAARDEAIRSCSLAAMALMLAAQDRGYATCPVGFNPVQVKALLAISDELLPVMLITVGRAALGNSARRPRLPLNHVRAFNSARTVSTRSPPR